MSIDWDEVCARDQAWAAAREHYLANGTHVVTDGRAQRCIESKDKHGMTDMCWSAIKTAHSGG